MEGDMRKMKMKMIIRIRIALFVSVVLCMLLTGFVAIAQEGQIVRETVYSPSLEGNLLGDSPNRAFTIYLPPSYDAGPDMLYPVVYLLHGRTCNNDLWNGGYGGNILNSMKSWLKSEKVKGMILVMPNSYNRFTGSYYNNSAATGNWADFIAEDLVAYIDSHYRTLPQRESRAVIGHSMGGYGGMTLGLDYPDVFGCMGSMSGLLDMTQFPARTSWAFAQAAKLENLSDFYFQNFNVQWSIAISTAIAPNLNKPPFYADFPWEHDSSNKVVQNQTAWDRFLERDVLTRLSMNVETLRSMQAIYLDCGTSDPYGFLVDAQRVHDELQRLNVAHDYRELGGNHTSCLTTSTGNALEVFSEAMAFEMLLVGVEPAGKLTTTWGQIRGEE